jgi:hypothetical protein
VARSVYKYRIDLSGKEKLPLRQAKKKGRKDARLVLRILMIMLADGSRISRATTLHNLLTSQDHLQERNERRYRAATAASASCAG